MRARFGPYLNVQWPIKQSQQHSIIKETKMENKNAQAITPEMAIGDVIGRYPNTVPVFMGHGLACVGCAVARFENIGQGAMAHGINIDALMQDLNRAVQQPQAGR